MIREDCGFGGWTHTWLCAHYVNLSDTYVKCVLFTGLYVCDYVIMRVYASINIFGVWHHPERRLRRFKDLFLFLLEIHMALLVWCRPLSFSLKRQPSSECRNTNDSVAGRLVLSPTVQFTSFGRGMVAPSIELLRCLQDSTSFEGFQPWRELACDDFCQLAWLFRRYSWHVQWDLEVWSDDCWCIGALPQRVRMSNHINSQMGGNLKLKPGTYKKTIRLMCVMVERN